MMSHGYEPENIPADEDFGMPMTMRQSNYLQQVRESYGRTGQQFRTLCDTILEGYGFPVGPICYGRAEMLIDFFSKSAARHKRAAERAAWRDLI